jgi:hypothetical protein
VGSVAFPEGYPVRLRIGYGISLSVLSGFRSSIDADQWTTRPASYLHHVYDRDGREIVAFHWHPERRGYDAPHAHFRQLNDPIPMGKVHVPTGWIPLPTVVRFLIEELDVEPLRPDWREVLEEAERTVVAPATR